MPELPELTVWARQVDRELTGKTIAAIEARQPKCLNVTPDEMTGLLVGRTIIGARERGKWLIIDLAREEGRGTTGQPDAAGHLLLNLGMGGSFHYQPAAVTAGALSERPEKYQFRLDFTDGATLVLRFSWFGYVHAVKAGGLGRHQMTAALGPSPLDPGLTLERFKLMVAAHPRRRVKPFLMDQRNLAGIGNVYIQDSLWGAGLHPDRTLGSLLEEEVGALWVSVRRVLERSVAKGGLAYETDLYGQRGGLTGDDFDVGYKPGRPCPRCGTAVEKIRTGSTSTFICPSCQKP